MWRPFTNIYTANIPPSREQVQVMAYSDNIYKHEYNKNYMQPCLHKGLSEQNQKISH